MFGFFKKPSRLSQWNGRRRSSRSEDPSLPNVFCRVVLLRLAAVLVTVLGATYLAHNWGGLMTYRAGEVRPYDLAPASTLILRTRKRQRGNAIKPYRNSPRRIRICKSKIPKSSKKSSKRRGRPCRMSSRCMRPAIC